MTDESYLLLESTLGVVAPMQVVWVFPSDPGIDAVSAAHARLIGGPLDRVVRPPRVHGARPRWARPTGVARLRIDPDTVDDTVDDTDTDTDAVRRWAAGHLGDAPIAAAAVPGGRCWEMATVGTRSGGRVVSVVASHVVADGRRFVETLASALAGCDPDPTDVPATVSSSREVAHDVVDAIAATGDAARSLRRLVAASRARPPGPTGSSRPAPSAPPDSPPPVGDCTPEHRVLSVPRTRWDDAARRRGGTSTTLLVALAADLARQAGLLELRSGPSVPLRVSVAVDRRDPGDAHSANAAGGVSVRLDQPVDPADGLAGIRAAVRTAVAEPVEDDAVARLARLLPRGVLGRVIASIPGPHVSVSHLGEAPVGLRACGGVGAEEIVVRAATRTVAARLARGMLPGIAVWAVGHGDRVAVAVCGADPVFGSGAVDLDELMDRVAKRWGVDDPGVVA
ncbi:hypothetical protein [Williamsia deligens]|uniref:Diacylglycerol O-acyltransferase n=1 Tax=Williamsia deligens TaxID=321325 RepID=A0ABW3G9E7_9NOCA|nr:hypothetical protein [Williamsia deligens]